MTASEAYGKVIVVMYKLKEAKYRGVSITQDDIDSLAYAAEVLRNIASFERH